MLMAGVIDDLSIFIIPAISTIMLIWVVFMIRDQREEMRRRAVSPEDLRQLVEEVGRLRSEVKALVDRLRERQ